MYVYTTCTWECCGSLYIHNSTCMPVHNYMLQCLLQFETNLSCVGGLFGYCVKVNNIVLTPLALCIGKFVWYIWFTANLTRQLYPADRAAAVHYKMFLLSIIIWLLSTWFFTLNSAVWLLITIYISCKTVTRQKLGVLDIDIQPERKWIINYTVKEYEIYESII